MGQRKIVKLVLGRKFCNTATNCSRQADLSAPQY